MLFSERHRHFDLSTVAVIIGPFSVQFSLKDRLLSLLLEFSVNTFHHISMD